MQGPDLRVILVGRTGLDQSLRRDSGIELIRAATAMDALGELADPIDEESPARAVVIVGNDAEPGQETGDEEDAVALWIASLRRIEPGVRVLRALDNGSPADPAFDGGVRTDADAPTLRALLEDPPEIPTESPAKPADPSTPAPRALIEPAPTEPTRVEPATTEPMPRVAPPRGVSGESRERSAAEEMDESDGAPLLGGDSTLVAAMLQGRSIIEPAVETLRRRTRRFDLRFEERVEDSGAVAATRDGVMVAWRGRIYGRLVTDSGAGSGARGASLEEAARWLASWLRLEEQQRELRRAAFIDPLTGAWNRRYFDRYLLSAIAQARPRRGSVTVLVFDIDDFKRFNDRYGHAAGDEILKEAVKLISGAIRPDDRVCRIGGDEFAVIFPDAPREAGSRPPESVFHISRRFQRAISEHKFPKLGEQAPGTLTISGGLATYPWDGSTADELLDRADRLALESKRLGKNAITFGPGAARANGPATADEDSGLTPTED